MNIRTNNGPSPDLTIPDLGNGSCQIRGDGIPFRTYRIEFAGDEAFANWQPLGTAPADEFGIFVYLDPAGSLQRYYRSVYP